MKALLLVFLMACAASAASPLSPDAKNKEGLSIVSATPHAQFMWATITVKNDRKEPATIVPSEFCCRTNRGDFRAGDNWPQRFSVNRPGRPHKPGVRPQTPEPLSIMPGQQVQCTVMFQHYDGENVEDVFWATP